MYYNWWWWFMLGYQILMTASSWHKWRFYKTWRWSQCSFLTSIFSWVGTWRGIIDNSRQIRGHKSYYDTLMLNIMNKLITLTYDSFAGKDPSPICKLSAPVPASKYIRRMIIRLFLLATNPVKVCKGMINRCDFGIWYDRWQWNYTEANIYLQKD